MADARKRLNPEVPSKRLKVDKTTQEESTFQVANVGVAHSTNNAAQAFAKLDTLVSEQEMVSLTTCTRKENNVALPKCLAEDSSNKMTKLKEAYKEELKRENG